MKRAKRSLLFALLAFVAFQAALAVAVEAFVRLRDPMFGDKNTRLLERIRTKTVHGRPPVTVVMLGSSRAGYGFHGMRVEEILEPALGRPVVAFNFGIPAAGPVTQLVYLKRLLGEGVRPELVLIEVLPSMLAETIPTPEGPEPGPLEKYWFFPDRLRREEAALVARYGFSEEEARRTWWESVAHPWYTLRFPLLGRVIPGWLPWSQRYDYSRGTDACGWSTPVRQTVTPEEHRRGVERSRGEYAPVLADLTPGGVAARALEDSLRACRGAGVPAALVWMPEGTEFRQFYPPHVRGRLAEYLGRLSETYGVPLIDARDWVADADFTDGHHLLRRGAERFSERLAREELLPRLGRGE
ncbi:MAG TPA: DUF1574 family protein [Gemmataceae bacterium]